MAGAGVGVGMLRGAGIPLIEKKNESFQVLGMQTKSLLFFWKNSMELSGYSFLNIYHKCDKQMNKNAVIFSYDFLSMAIE